MKKNLGFSLVEMTIYMIILAVFSLSVFTFFKSENFFFDRKKNVISWEKDFLLLKREIDRFFEKVVISDNNVLLATPEGIEFNSYRIEDDDGKNYLLRKKNQIIFTPKGVVFLQEYLDKKNKQTTRRKKYFFICHYQITGKAYKKEEKKLYYQISKIDFYLQKHSPNDEERERKYVYVF